VIHILHTSLAIGIVGETYPPGSSHVLEQIGAKFQCQPHVFRLNHFIGGNGIADLVNRAILLKIQDGARKSNLQVYWHLWLLLVGFRELFQHNQVTLTQWDQTDIQDKCTYIHARRY